MRLPLAVLATAGLIVAGCGWSPPGAPPPKADTCTPADGPTPDTVQREINATATTSGPWAEVARGHTLNCTLHWVQIAPTEQQPDSPQQVLFFDRNTPLGPATPAPRPYVSVLTGGEDTVQVQYQWRQGDEAPCCPTGIGTVRFRIGQDGTLEALDPIPNS
ncbi:LppP/LprE family lipoprotein [Mycolicibacterium sp. S2-37]|uniref:LppP/LprE family lipoprotein n=1 Tax=Mycolicibacterium sp. S2-37 TaxID=2810297 RepID=UPI001A94418E|nr:LppP/LprE family lipoprotein [Mycolicibacterium sp. S2-37]MBO0678301.1 LppP/LprE family lipoprotein [Mycolicibacterium sp. S2-37]